MNWSQKPKQLTLPALAWMPMDWARLNKLNWKSVSYFWKDLDMYSETKVSIDSFDECHCLCSSKAMNYLPPPFCCCRSYSTQKHSRASLSVRSHKQRLIVHAKTIPAVCLKERLMNQTDEIKGPRLGVKGKKENGQTAVARCKSVLSCLVVNIKEPIASPLNGDQTSNAGGRAGARVAVPRDSSTEAHRRITRFDKHSLISSGRCFCTTFTSATFNAGKSRAKCRPR